MRYNVVPAMTQMGNIARSANHFTVRPLVLSVAVYIMNGDSR